MTTGRNMPFDVRLTIKEALRIAESSASDDLNRAKSAFNGYTVAQLEEPYGDSGTTRANVLQQYQEQLDDVNEAIEWINRNV